jgi:antitoxin component of RelBE/YafQ-DinJ toxin-antitoxin module
MNTKTTITIKTDKKLRDAAKRTALKLGIPLTTVMNAQLAQFVSEGRFEVSLAPRPEKVREWERVSEEFERHPERFKASSAEDFIASLRS